MDIKQRMDLEKEEIAHLELGPRQGRDVIEYPNALRQMDQPPEPALLEEAQELTLRDQALPMGATFKANWRLMLCSAPFLFSCVGQGYDSGASGITNTM